MTPSALTVFSIVVDSHFMALTTITNAIRKLLTRRATTIAATPYAPREGETRLTRYEGDLSRPGQVGFELQVYAGGRLYHEGPLWVAEAVLTSDFDVGRYVMIPLAKGIGSVIDAEAARARRIIDRLIAASDTEATR